MKTVIVVGLGYVGLPLAILIKKKGYNVIGIDIDKDKVKNINCGINHFKDREISKQLKKYPITASFKYDSIKKADIVIVAVPTPVYKNHQPNLKPVKSACTEVAKKLKKGALVIVESTYNPFTTRSVVKPIIEKNSGLVVGRDIFLSYCPERLNPADKKWTIENIPRVVGSLEKKGLSLSLKFYRSIIKANIIAMNSLEEAEAVKVFENCFRDVNIALVNEFSKSFDRLGINFYDVLKGAITKPFAILSHFPGCGVGGQCIPVDPYYMIDFAKRRGFLHKLLITARSINNSMPVYAVNLLMKKLKKRKLKINDTAVTLLGLAYKAETDSVSESPSLVILDLLRKKGFKVQTFDPYITSNSSVNSLEEALKGSKAVIISTAHKVFQKITPQLFVKNNIKILIDGRNCLHKEKYLAAGIDYAGIGRN